MKIADKSGSRYSLVIGDEEIASGLVEVKEMSSGTATSVRLDSLASALK
jgi:histidyl-tRNA synthetase